MLESPSAYFLGRYYRILNIYFSSPPFPLWCANDERVKDTVHAMASQFEQNLHSPFLLLYSIFYNIDFNPYHLSIAYFYIDFWEKYMANFYNPVAIIFTHQSSYSTTRLLLVITLSFSFSLFFISFVADSHPSSSSRTPTPTSTAHRSHSSTPTATETITPSATPSPTHTISDTTTATAMASFSPSSTHTLSASDTTSATASTLHHKCIIIYGNTPLPIYTTLKIGYVTSQKIYRGGFQFQIRLHFEVSFTPLRDMTILRAMIANHSLLR